MKLKIKLIALMLTTLLFHSVNDLSWAQTLQTEWMNWNFNGSMSSRDNIVKVSKATSGNIYITGNTEKDISNFDITTFSLSDSGTINWTHNLSWFDKSYSLENVIDMYVDANDNVYIVGHTYDRSRGRIIAAKYNRNGNVVWQRKIEETYLYNAYSITADVSGAAYILVNRNGEKRFLKLNANGQFVKEIDALSEREVYKSIYTPDNYLYTLGSVMSENYANELLLTKFDTAGNMLSRHNYTSDIWYDIESVVDVKFDENHNLYILSNIYTEGRRFDDYRAIQLQKINSEGQLFWTKIYNGEPKNLDKACNLKLIGDTSVFVGGYSFNDTTLRDVFLLEYNESGTLIDSFLYNGIYNQSDYLHSLCVDSERNKYLAVTTFTNEWQFYSEVVKINDTGDTCWKRTSPISLSNRIYPEKCILNSKENKLVVIGNRRSTNNTELSYDTNSDYWIMQLDTNGTITDEKLYSDIGTSNTFDAFLTMDSENNIYESAKVRKGPRYYNGDYFYNFFLQLRKIDPNGNELWNQVIDIEPAIIHEYHGHKMINDTTLILISNSYYEGNNFSNFIVYNHNGELIDSVNHLNSYRETYNSVIDYDGAIYTYEQLFGDSSKIKRFNPDLSLDWVISFNQNVNFKYKGNMAIDANNNLLFSTGEGALQRISQDGKVTNIGEFPNISDIKTDHAGNIYICGGTGVSGGIAVHKLTSEGGIQWSYASSGIINSELALLKNGDVAVMGASCGIVNCSGARIYLINSLGQYKGSKYMNIPFQSVSVDSNDNVIVNGKTHLIRLNNQLQQLSTCEYVNDSILTENIIYDFLVDDNNNIYTAAGSGNLTQLNTHLWNALATTKYSSQNRNPYFVTYKESFQIKLSDTINFHFDAYDHEGDPINYFASSLPSFLNLDSITGVLYGVSDINEPREYSFSIIAKDEKGGTDRIRVGIRSNNSAPILFSVGNDSVKAGDGYFFEPEVIDPEFDKVSLTLEPDNLWFTCEGYGYITGRPQIADTGTYEIIIKAEDVYGAISTTSYFLTVYTDEVIVDPDPDTIPDNDDSDTTDIDIDNTSSVLPGTEDSFNIFPNPFSEVIHLDLSGYLNTRVDISLRNLNGRLVYHKVYQVRTDNLMINDLKGLPEGIYILEIKNNQKKSITKVFKVH